MKGILFDFDGTLVDSMWVWCQTDCELLNRYGYCPDQQYTKTIATLTFTQGAQYILDRYQIKRTVPQMKQELTEIALEKYRNHVVLKKGVVALLNTLKQWKVKIAIATSCVPVMCEEVLKKYQIYDFFEQIIYADTLGFNKDNPQFFLLAAQHLGLEAKECTVFEDSVHAAQGAKEAGMKVVGVYDEFSKQQQTTLQQLCHYYLPSLEESLKGDFLIKNGIV